MKTKAVTVPAPVLRVQPFGKWYHIKLDERDGVVILPMSVAEKPQTGLILAAGSFCQAKAGERIVFRENMAQEVQIDGVKLLLIHEDHVFGLVNPAQDRLESFPRRLRP